MNAIHPIAQTDDTVTLRRADFEMMLEAVEDAEDIMALRTAAAHETEIGTAAARADHLPVDVVLRLLAGEHPVRVWRQRAACPPRPSPPRPESGAAIWSRSRATRSRARWRPTAAWPKPWGWPSTTCCRGRAMLPRRAGEPPVGFHKK